MSKLYIIPFNIHVPWKEYVTWTTSYLWYASILHQEIDFEEFCLAHIFVNRYDVRWFGG
jgi:hypothetical protein